MTKPVRPRKTPRSLADPSPAPPTATRLDAEDLYLRHRETIDAAIGAVCRKFRLSSSDGDDFAGDFRLRLVREDYAVLRRFRGESSLRTYLLVVVTRAFQDWRNARWGKWRTSAEAKRLGPLAESLERLVVRNGHTLDEAHQMLESTLGVPIARQTVETIIGRLPRRQARRFVDGSELQHLAIDDEPADRRLVRHEEAASARAAGRALTTALQALDDEDQVVIRMRFFDGIAVADIARALHLDHKALYRRIERLMGHLRRSLEHQGLTADRLTSVLVQGAFDIDDPGTMATSAIEEPAARPPVADDPTGVS